MNERVSLTALVTGMPLFVHGPQLQKGETELQFLVRHYQVEWENCITDLSEIRGVSEKVCAQLRALNLRDIDDPAARTKVVEWVNWRLPTVHRTLTSLCDLRDLQNYEEVKRKFKEVGGYSLSRQDHEERIDFLGFELIQILWPQEKRPNSDKSREKVEKTATSMGIEVIPLETDISKELNLAEVLPRVKGNLLWLVPGGSKVLWGAVEMGLKRVLDQFRDKPSMAAYFDGSYSLVYRVSALREIARKIGFISPNQQEVGSMLREAGYSLSGDRDPTMALCKIEQIYGGNDPVPRHQKTGWFRRIFRLLLKRR